MPHTILSYSDKLFTPSESFIPRAYHGFDKLKPVFIGHDRKGPTPDGFEAIEIGPLHGPLGETGFKQFGWVSKALEDRLRAECEEGAAMGFDGKTLIHPSQVGICNEVFAPSPADVEQAQAVIEAFADPENAGKGVLKVNGKMTELLHLAEAKRLVAVSEAIEAMQG